MSSKQVTPLLEFLQAIPGKDQKEAFARAVGVKQLTYLYQLAAKAHPNPRVRLALAICAESRRLARKYHTRPLTIDDLLVGKSDGSEEDDDDPDTL